MNRCFSGNTRLVYHSFFKWRFHIYYWLNLYYVYAWDNTCRCLIRQALFLYDELRQFLISRFIMGVFFVSQIIFRKGWIWLYKILKTGESIYQGTQRYLWRMPTYSNWTCSENQCWPQWFILSQQLLAKQTHFVFIIIIIIIFAKESNSWVWENQWDESMLYIIISLELLATIFSIYIYNPPLPNKANPFAKMSYKCVQEDRVLNHTEHSKSTRINSFLSFPVELSHFWAVLLFDLPVKFLKVTKALKS